MQSLPSEAQALRTFKSSSFSSQEVESQEIIKNLINKSNSGAHKFRIKGPSFTFMGLLSRSTVAVRPPPLWGGVPEDCIPRDMDGDLHLQPIGS